MQVHKPTMISNRRFHWCRTGKRSTHRAEPSRPPRLSPASQTCNMLPEAHHPNYHSHIQSLNVTSQLVRAELILIHYIQVQAGHQRIVGRLNMIHLLVEPTHQGPELFIRQFGHQRRGHICGMIIPTHISNFAGFVVLLDGTFDIVISTFYGERMAVAGGVRGRRTRRGGCVYDGTIVGTARGCGSTGCGLHVWLGARGVIGLMLGVIEVGIWDRTSILENIAWHRHAEGSIGGILTSYRCGMVWCGVVYYSIVDDIFIFNCI